MNLSRGTFDAVVSGNRWQENRPRHRKKGAEILCAVGKPESGWCRFGIALYRPQKYRRMVLLEIEEPLWESSDGDLSVFMDGGVPFVKLEHRSIVEAVTRQNAVDILALLRDTTGH